MNATAAYVSETCRLYVLVVLVAAAVGKLLAQRTFRDSVGALLQVSGPVARAGAIVVIGAEGLAAGLLMAGGAFARIGAILALVLFLAFAAVILNALAQRREVNCACFGGSDHAISGWDLGRNGLLMAACAAYATLPPAGPVPQAAYLLLAPLAALLAFGTANLDQRAGPPAAVRTPPALEPGQLLPPFEGRARSDGRRRTQADLAGRATVLLFLGSGCPKCRDSVPQLARMLPAMRRADVAFWIVAMEREPDSSPLLAGTPLMDHLLILDRAARERLNPGRATPHYLFIDHDLVVQASGLAGDDDWLSFVEQMREIEAAA